MKIINTKTMYFCTMVFDSAVVAVAIFLGINSGNPLIHLEERGFLTLISFFQLLTISLISLTVFLILRNQETSKRLFWQNSFVIWVIASLGFLFLAVDERYKIHEGIDNKIHDIFYIQETGITDRIDDLIIALYALVGIAILYIYRKELIQYREALRFIKYAFLILFVMIFLDILSNRSDILQFFINDSRLANKIVIWLSVIEDSLKIFAEGYFLIGFYSVFYKIKKTSANMLSKNSDKAASIN